MMRGPIGSIDRYNSTGTPLGAAETWTGAWNDVAAYSTISIIAEADVAGTLFADFSVDGNTALSQIQMSDGTNGSFGIHNLIVVAQYFRVRVVNGAAPQTSLSVQTILNTGPRIALPTSRLSQSLTDFADVLNTRSAIFGQQPGGAYANAGLDENNNLAVAVKSPLTGFGELRNAELTPVVQIDATYGLLDNVETFTGGTGSADSDTENFRVQTGAGVGGYGVIRSLRALRYRPGQGSVFRFTALFDGANKVANSLQAAGAFNATNGFFVGFDGANDFGVMHRTGGRHEVRTFTIAVAASGAETLNLELNTVTYNIPVTAGSIPHNAYEVATWLNANQSVWEAFQNGNTVVLFGLNPGPLAGAYTVGSTGTIAGSIAQDNAGVANTETWTYQGSFTDDQLDGSGPSGMTIDPDNGNVYEIDMRYLGYGEVVMKVENPTTGSFFAFHRFQFSNTRTSPTLANPTLKVGWIAESLGSTTNLTVRGASGMAGTDGVQHPFRRPRSFSFLRGSVGATITSVFAIRVRSEFRGLVQLSEVLPKIAFVSPEGNKACTVKFLLNPTFDAAASEPNWQYVGQNLSIVETDTVGTTFTDTGGELASFIVAGGANDSLNFVDLAEASINPIHLGRGDVLAIAAQITGGAGNHVTASMTWLED